MDAGTILTDILVVLVAARMAAELTPRLGIPSVVGEIVAGFLVGPAVLGLVHPSEALDVLAQLGVILLLVEVGMQMDLADLRPIGRSALSVALLGVAAPFALGFVIVRVLGGGTELALFLGASLTATSVGITARVFSELRLLASVEARTVLGAAVADDVIGLVILAVVGALVAGAGVSLPAVAVTVTVAVGFLLLSVGAGLRFGPRAFEIVSRLTRSEGALVALSLAFVLLLAQLAGGAGLAPVVGAFVAGLVLARHPSRHRIRSELVPLGHLLVPVFFLQIGINLRLPALLDPAVVLTAGALLLVAAGGKIASALVAGRGDRLLIGLGMLPRGEVGLIFAGLGLRQGILDDAGYSSLVVVVLLTTLAAPPLLRWRAAAVRGWSAARTPATATGAAESGLVVTGGIVELGAAPSSREGLETALRAALAVAQPAAPGDGLLEWLRRESSSLTWNRPAAAAFLELLRRGNERSWRFLEVTGVLERVLPELAGALLRRREDAFELDPEAPFRWPLIERLQEGGSDPQVGPEINALKRPERLFVAALVQETAGPGAEGVRLARRLAQRLDLGAAAEQQVVRLLQEGPLLWAAATRLDAFAEEAVLQLAVHFGSAEQARAGYVMAAVERRSGQWERARLDELHRLIQTELAHTELTDRGARNLVERKRTIAIGQASGDDCAASLIRAAPWRHVISQEPAKLVTQARLIEGLNRTGRPACCIEQMADEIWSIELVHSDCTRALVGATSVLLELGLDVISAATVVWDRTSVLSVVVRGSTIFSSDDIERAMRSRTPHALRSTLISDAEVAFDNEASPWHTLCDIRASDRRGLLHAIAVAAAASGIDVRAALAHTESGRADDRFELVDRRGNKLSARDQRRFMDVLGLGVREPQRGRLFLRTVGSPFTSVHNLLRFSKSVTKS